MHFNAHYSLWCRDVSTYIENETLCHEPGMSVIFHLCETSGSEKHPSMEISRNSSKVYWWCCYLLVVIMYLIISILWSVCTGSQSVSAIYRYISHWLWQEVENFFMQIISHVTDENQFLNRGISFSLRKPTRGNIYGRQPQSLLTLFSVKIAADQLINLSSILFAESGFEQQVSTK